LAGLQATQEAAMQDECVLLERTSASSDAYGMPVKGYTDGDTVECGLDDAPKKEQMGSAEVPAADAILRLPLAAEADIANVDRVRITKRFGAAITPVVYEFLSRPRRGPSGLTVRLALTTTE
jgi:head-tail adaptor